MLTNLLLLLLCLHGVPSFSKHCPPFPHAILENGRVTSSPGEGVLLFQCDPGFFLASPPLVRCWKGNWTSTKSPRCIKSEGRCEDPTAISNGEVYGDERSVGSTVQYICKPGFLLLGEGRRECLQSGHWSGITPACMDESEPLQKVADRLKEHFVFNLSTTNESVPGGRLLDRDSLHHGLELVILIDRSSSIDPQDFKTAINFVKFLIQEFGARNGDEKSTMGGGTRVAVLTFGSKVDLLFNLDNTSISGPTAANQALDTVQDGGGGTALEEALTSVFTLLSPVREGAKKAIFLMTDGEPNIGTPGITPEDVAIQLKDAGGFEIFTMGVGRGINRKLLSDLSSPPLLNHVFILDKYSDLKGIMKAITDSSHKARAVSSERCGYIKDQSFHLKKWPWLAAIYVGSPPLRLCTGTLICSQWIITAASCFNSTLGNREPVFIALGENNIVQDEKQQMNFYATRVVLHPSYNPFLPLHDNLALLQLNFPFQRFRPACLPPTDRAVPLHMDLNINASIAGWGLAPSSHLRIDGATHRFNRTTESVELAEQHECRRITGSAFNANLFCAGFGKKMCAGDVGSPVIAVDPSTQLHHILGVLGGREKCEQEGLNHYTELTSYIAWINSVTDRCHSKHWMA